MLKVEILECFRQSGTQYELVKFLEWPTQPQMVGKYGVAEASFNWHAYFNSEEEARKYIADGQPGYEPYAFQQARAFANWGEETVPHLQAAADGMQAIAEGFARLGRAMSNLRPTA